MFEYDDLVKIVQTGEEELATVNNMVEGVAEQLNKLEPPPPKYQIVDLYWLVNTKLINGKLEPGEASLVILAYNVQFGNLRISFYRGNNIIDLERGFIFRKRGEQVAAVAIYPEQLARIIEREGKEDQFVVMDRIIGEENQEWIENKKQAARVHIQNRTLKITYNDVHYTFTGLQYNLLLACCKLILAHGWFLTALSAK